MSNFLFVFADAPHELNTSVFRCMHPAQALKRAGHKATLVSIPEVGAAKVEQLAAGADAIIVQRNITPTVLACIKAWRKAGHFVAVDIDDAYELLPRHNPAFLYWRLGLGGDLKPLPFSPIELLRAGIAEADALITPSVLLADDYAGVARRQVVIPNRIDFNAYESKQQIKNKTFVIGWGGSNSHLVGFASSGVAEALRDFCSTRSDVRVVVCAPRPDVYNLLDIPDDQKHYHAWDAYNKWPAAVSKWTIGIAPVCGASDARRSALRLTELAAASVPWLASGEPPYNGQHFTSALAGGLLVENTPAGWLSGLVQIHDELRAWQKKSSVYRQMMASHYDIRNGANDYLALLKA